MRVCTSCHQDLPDTDFSPCGRGYRRRICKVCRRPSIREHYKRGAKRRASVTEKRCTVCLVTKSLSDFHKGGGAGGRRAECAECSNKLRRTQYHTSKTVRDDTAARSSAWRQENYTLRGQAWVSATARNARHRAAKYGLPFDEEAVRTVLKAAPDNCPVFGTPFRAGGGLTSDSPSLDRIRPNLGYVAGNMCVVSVRANAIKHNASPEEILQVAEYYSGKG
jgi:hypothetical protein